MRQVGRALLVLALVMNCFAADVWIESSLTRIGQDTGPTPFATDGAKLLGGHGEYASFQVAIRARDQPLRIDDIQLPFLTGPRNSSIPEESIAIYRENYVQVKYSSPSNGKPLRPAPPGFFADPLIPLVDPETGQKPKQGSIKSVPYTILPHQNLPFWIDIHIPMGGQNGMYKGVLSIQSSRGTFKQGVEIEVLPFTLPLTPTLHSAFLTKAPNPANQAAIARELLRAKVMPMKVPPDSVADLRQQFGLSMIGLGAWSGADVNHCQMNGPPSASDLLNQTRMLRSGLRDKVSRQDFFIYNYTADEISRCTNLYGEIREWAHALHRAGVKQLIVMNPVAELLRTDIVDAKPAVDIWAILPKQLHKAAAQLELAKKVSEVWSYNDLVQDQISPKWLLDYPLLDYRIQPGFINQSLGFAGSLYWSVDRWNSDAWNDVDGAFEGNHYPGEGMLLYPGEPAGLSGVAPSIRLKEVRDGVQDFEYVALLRAAGDHDFVASVLPQIAKGFETWDDNPQNLLEWHARIAHHLAALSSKRSGGRVNNIVKRNNSQ